jgi:hypothetical protein
MLNYYFATKLKSYDYLTGKAQKSLFLRGINPQKRDSNPQ